MLTCIAYGQDDGKIRKINSGVTIIKRCELSESSYEIGEKVHLSSLVKENYGGVPSIYEYRMKGQILNMNSEEIQIQISEMSSSCRGIFLTCLYADELAELSQQNIGKSVTFLIGDFCPAY